MARLAFAVGIGTAAHDTEFPGSGRVAKGNGTGVENNVTLGDSRIANAIDPFHQLEPAIRRAVLRLAIDW
jgi:hypothetical protein